VPDRPEGIEESLRNEEAEHAATPDALAVDDEQPPPDHPARGDDTASVGEQLSTGTGSSPQPPGRSDDAGAGL
jgi:hypothetical protein